MGVLLIFDWQLCPAKQLLRGPRVSSSATLGLTMAVVNFMTGCGWVKDRQLQGLGLGGISPPGQLRGEGPPQLEWAPQ